MQRLSYPFNFDRFHYFWTKIAERGEIQLNEFLRWGYLNCY